MNELRYLYDAILYDMCTIITMVHG